MEVEVNKLVEGIDPRDGIGIGPDGEFDLDLVPAELKDQVEAMAALFANKKDKYFKLTKKRYKKKAKPRAKKPKTFGKNKKKRKK
jgi:hypothetical protein